MTDEKKPKKVKKVMYATPIHNWLLISACVMTFIIFPLLFVWSSLNIIHNRTADAVLLSEAAQFGPDMNQLKKMPEQQRTES